MKSKSNANKLTRYLAAARMRLASGSVEYLIVGVVLIVGAILRFRHLDWAKGYYFQPEEGFHTINYVLRLPPSLNPYEIGTFTYGHLPLYLYHFTVRVLGRVTQNSLWLDKWHVTLVARFYAALASTLTIVLVYGLWRRVNGRFSTGVISAIALAMSPLAIQYAHYGVVDTLMVFWLMLATLLSVEAWRHEAKWLWCLVGGAVGLAVATKTSGLLWASIFVIAALGKGLKKGSWVEGLWILILGSCGMLIAVIVTAPYYLLDWSAFRQVMAMQSAKTVTGKTLCTYHWQFLNVMPYVYELEQLGKWALGLPLFGLAAVGYIILSLSIWQARDPVKWLLILVPPTLYFLGIGLWHAKFIRYLLPLIPYAATFAAQPFHLSVKIQLRLLRWSIIGVAIVVLIYSAFLGISVSNIYVGPDPRIQASDWMLENIQPGAKILHDPEPMITLPLRKSDLFETQYLNIFENKLQDINDIDYYAERLSDKQYVVVVSRRHQDRVQHLSALFPVASCYYRSLFNGNLGYQLAAEFLNYPHFGPFVWNTDKAEQTFQVFDHPRVYIFERSENVSVQSVKDAIHLCLSP